MTAETALRVGMAAGRYFIRGDHRHRVVIGKDTRLSGYMIETALVAGFTSVGMDVLQFGPLPTPAVAMLTRSLRADLGVMISASHNAYEDNGIKLFGPDGYKLSDEVETAIEDDDGQRPRTGPRRTRQARPRQAHRRRASPLHRIRQAHVPGPPTPRRPAHRPRLRERRRLSSGAGSAVGTRRRSHHDRRQPERLQHQPANAARPLRKRCAPRSRKAAPISASRSTATPTASSSPTRRAASSTAIKSWR